MNRQQLKAAIQRQTWLKAQNESDRTGHSGPSRKLVKPCRSSCHNSGKTRQQRTAAGDDDAALEEAYRATALERDRDAALILQILEVLRRSPDHPMHRALPYLGQLSLPLSPESRCGMMDFLATTTGIAP